MTKGQLVTFCIIARCAYYAMAVNVMRMFRSGDPSFDEAKVQLVLVRSYLKTLRCYDPQAQNNCLSSDDIDIIVEQVSQILGLCGDPFGLDESDITCCDKLNGVNILK